MTTQTFSSVIDHSTDAAFRTWGQELNTNLAAAGLVQTSDTGQINWTTVTRPGTSTAAGYEIWRLPDSSLYFKIEYGTAGTATVPGLWITVGTGSNGSGTLTGQTNTRNTIHNGSTLTSTSTSYPSYICVTNNALGLLWKVGSGGAAGVASAFVLVGKTVDSTGAATSTGFGVLRMNGTSNITLQSVRTAATAATYTESTNFACFPGSPTTSNVGADLQAYICWLNVPQVVPFAWACGYIKAEISAQNSFSTAIVGSTSHTYLAVGLANNGSSLVNAQGANYSVAMLWE